MSTERQALGNIIFEEAMKRLTAQQYDIMQMYLVEGYTLCEIAKMRGISPQSVYRCLRRGLKKLREYLCS